MTYNHLSPAERKVLTLIALGREDKEIALELGMSPWTVKTHLQNLRDKLGALNPARRKEGGGGKAGAPPPPPPAEGVKKKGGGPPPLPPLAAPPPPFKGGGGA